MRRSYVLPWSGAAFCLVACCRTVLAVSQRSVTSRAAEVRTEPRDEVAAVAGLARGDVVSVEREDSEDWLQIAPHDKIRVWVYGDLVREGVASSPASVRSGPGLEFPPVARVGKGTRLEVLGEAGDWLRIAPPPGCRFFIRRRDTGAIPKPETPSVPSPERPETVKPAPAPGKTPPSAAALSGREAVGTPPAFLHQEAGPWRAPEGQLVASAAQGTPVQPAGIVRPSWALRRNGGRFCLVDSDARGRPLTVCHLTGCDDRLGAMAGKRVSIVGRQYWLQGVRQPVVVVEQIRMENGGRSESQKGPPW